ncbi:membrane protein [Xanthomonas oryzae pv. oryzae]|nr:membrane protein [Xanthomonas oryzae pv. oryzae]
MRGPVERAVSAKTGREFHLGHLDVDLGRITTVRGERLSLGNASWSKRGAMAELNAAEIDVELWPLLRGKLRLPEIRLEHPTLLLEAGNDSHPGNWVFDQSHSDSSMPRLGRLLVNNGRLQYIDDASRSDVDVAINSLAPPSSDQRAAPISIDGKGRWKGYPFALKGNTASPLELSQSEHPFRIDLRGSAGATRTHVRGTLTNPFQLRVFDLQMALSGQDMADLYLLASQYHPHRPTRWKAASAAMAMSVATRSSAALPAIAIFLALQKSTCVRAGAAGSGRASDLRQRRHPQARQDQGMAGQTATLPHALHADLQLLAQSGRALVRPDHPTGDQARLLRLGG